MALALTACGPDPDTGPVRVSVIGGVPVLVDPGRGTLNTGSRLLIDALAQGLVRFDAGGQIEPGLAERWIVTDGGMSYIFRLRDARWADGSPVTAAEVASRLQREVGPGSLNPLAPFLTAVDQVVAMTPQVVEVRLRRPRPDLLKLFAQPELALLRASGGTGPFAMARAGHAPLLRPTPEPDDADAGKPIPVRPEEEVQLTAERAGLAMARFRAGRVDLVAGGTIVDWPLIARAAIAPADVRIDPAAGLFGLSIVSRDGFLADAANRAALAGAIDRTAVLGRLVGPTTTDRLLPDQLDSAAPPQAAAWTAQPLGTRLATARALVTAWHRPLRIRIALPIGPGATELWAGLATSLLAIGVEPVRVPLAAPAELRLLDAVAPYDSARWYLASACRPCSADALVPVLAARDAPTMAERARAIAAADAAVAADTPFIPLGRPWRWSLVAPRLRAWQPNARAWHPLDRLRPDAG